MTECKYKVADLHRHASKLELELCVGLSAWLWSSTSSSLFAFRLGSTSSEASVGSGLKAANSTTAHPFDCWS